MIKFEDIKKANESIITTGIERKDKNGKTIIKEYAEVNQRIKAFRMVYPEGLIQTELISNENGVCIFKATVGQINDENGIFKVLGTGTAYEKENSSFINKTSYIENCETSAVGRALGMAGFGIDTSVASAEEVQNAIEQQKELKPISDSKLKVLQSLIKDLPNAKEYYETVLIVYKVKDLKELNNQQYTELLVKIKKLKGE